MVRILLLLASVAVFGYSTPIDGPVSQHLLDNIQRIELHNANPNKTFFMKVSEMSKLSPDQYRRRLNFQIPDFMHNVTRFAMPAAYQGPPTMDWRKKGAVTGVKNMGTCDADYAFSVIGALEGQHAIKRGNLLELSEQNIIDCSANTGNNGCDGGNMISAYQYIIRNKGVDTQASYPWVGKIQSCKFSYDTVGETMSKVTAVHENEDDLLTACALNGPIQIAIDASHPSFQNYGGGVYNEPKCTSNTNYAMLLVGYDIDPKEGPYWILKNSVGTSWGEKGYMRLARLGNNLCGIASYAIYPTI